MFTLHSKTFSRRENKAIKQGMSRSKLSVPIFTCYFTKWNNETERKIAEQNR